MTAIAHLNNRTVQYLLITNKPHITTTAHHTNSPRATHIHEKLFLIGCKQYLQMSQIEKHQKHNTNEKKPWSILVLISSCTKSEI